MLYTYERDAIQQEDEEFYTPGSELLYQTRKWIAHYSLEQSKSRLDRERQAAQLPLSAIVQFRREFMRPYTEISAIGSQIAGERAIGQVRISPDNEYVLCGSWGGQLRLFGLNDLQEHLVVAGHQDRVGGLCWKIDFAGVESETMEVDRGGFDFVSSGGDGLVKIWKLAERNSKISASTVATLAGHIGRVSRIDLFPSGRLVASAGFDATWRLWDIESASAILVQEGHAREVYALRFQSDGALIATGGLDAIGRLWDLRTGRTIMVLDGHIREITAIDFRNAFQVATGSADDSIKIWDLRMVACRYTIPAHNSVVTDVRFQQGSQQINGFPRFGNVFVSSGYDGKLKIWSADDWQLLKTFAANEKKIMSCDISSDKPVIVSSGFDRTVKLWAI